MNGPIASKFLTPAAAELVERIPFFSDETTYSYVNRIACLTAAINRKQVVAMLFGSATILPERPLHCGFGHLAMLYTDANGAIPADLPQRFGMLSLYAPFVDAERYRRAIALVHGTRINGANEIIGLRAFGVFRHKPAVCLKCLEEDLSIGKPAHYCRTDQILAVACCPKHGTPLITTCCSCGAKLSHDEQPALNCRHCGAKLAHNESHPDRGFRASLQWRLAKFIQAAILGHLPNANADVRLGALRARVARDVNSRSGNVGDNLARTLSSAYGQPFLSSLGLLTDSAPTLAWPALFLQGHRFVSDPIANCLVMALLFDSIEDYANEVAIAVRQGVQQPLGRNMQFSATAVTIAVLKDLLRPLSIESVAKKHSIEPTELQRWVVALPGFSKRRLESGARVTLRNSKRNILKHLKQHSNNSRSSVAAKHRQEIVFVRKNDPAWLDHHLPPRMHSSHIAPNAN